MYFNLPNIRKSLEVSIFVRFNMAIKRRNRLITAAGATALLLLSVCDLILGGSGIGAAEALGGLFGGEGIASSIVWSIRLPRVLTAIAAGACLALSGAQMQSVFRNPLADPHIMGVSGGAGLGAAIATLLISGTGLLSGFSSMAGLTVAGAAFVGAILASALIVLVSSRFRSGTTLLVFGVMLGFIFSAITSILEYSASEESLKLFYSWSAGSFSGTRTFETLTIFAALLVGTGLYTSGAKGLDILLFGEEYATLAGASVRRIRGVAMVSSCLMTAAATAFCGPLGFVGIVSPHIARSLLRSSGHMTILPATLITGSAVSVLADIISQAPGLPLPVGSTMALIGIPIILLILMKK